MTFMRDFSTALKAVPKPHVLYVVDVELKNLCCELYSSGTVDPKQYNLDQLSRNITAGNLVIDDVPVRVARMV